MLVYMMVSNVNAVRVNNRMAFLFNAYQRVMAVVQYYFLGAKQCLIDSTATALKSILLLLLLLLY